MSAPRRSLTIVRRIRTTPAAAWNAFVDPREILHWWGPDAGPTLSAETDVRVGGAFKVAFATMDGEHHESHGEYLELDPPRRLVMSWWFGATPHARSRVTVSIEAIHDGIELTVQHDDVSDEGLRITHQQGWQGALAKMAAYVERRIEGGTHDI
jgi:uncharacterized protein YndB with AHSA1/START domain